MNVSVPMVPSNYPLLRFWQFKMLAVGSDAYGPLRPLVNVISYARMCYGGPLVNLCYSFIHFTRSPHLVEYR